MLLSMPSFDCSRTSSTAAAALLLGGLVIGEDVGKRVVGLLVPVELEEVVVVAPVLPGVVVPVVVRTVAVEPEDEVLLVVVEATPSSLYADPQ
jgi:hypothetical protein